MFFAIDLESRIASDHPLRPIKRMVDAELRRMSQALDVAYCSSGRPSVPPERILKAMLLQAIYWVRSERELCRRIDTDLLFRWFLDMDPAEDAFHHTVFPHNRERLEEHGFVQRFFDGVVRMIREAGLASDDHFTVDGTLIQSHASLKSLKRIAREDGAAEAAEDRRSDGDDNGHDQGWGPGGGRNASVDFRGERRTNATHRSTTDPDARLYRKGNGQPALLSHTGHAISENRHGLIVAVAVGEASGRAERDAALAMLDGLRRSHGCRPLTLGADKGYDDGAFLVDLRKLAITPHVAIRDGEIEPKCERSWARWLCRHGVDRKDLDTSQRKRKLVEEAFGWAKRVAGQWRARYVERWKIAQHFTIAAAAYNLVRARRLLMAS